MRVGTESISVALHRIRLDGGEAQVHLGGQGEPLVLLHGGWGGAAMHWSSTWEGLVRSGFRVIAPDLPGIGAPEQAGLGSLRACADWLARLLSALGEESAWVVGNSLGAAVGWSFALAHAPRCRGLVMVNGVPFPELPSPLRRLARSWPVRQVIGEVLRQVAYRPASLPRAFHQTARVPESIREVVHRAAPGQLAPIVDLFLTGEDAIPSVPVVLVWGDSDQLPGGKRASADALLRRMPGAVLKAIPGAGHLPQVEQPELFVRAVSEAAVRREP